MEKRRTTIRQRVKKLVLLISLAALLITSTAGLLSMIRIRRKSEASLIQQMEKSVSNLVSSKAGLADAMLGKFSGYVGEFSTYIHALYTEPEGYMAKEVLPPDAARAGSLSMQRYLAEGSIRLEDRLEELSLLGNLEQVWKPVMESNSSMITTIYAGTESGFLISCDDRADLGAVEAGEEAYYDYFETAWYQLAKQAGEPVFTDTYADAYGRGLMITCAAPFYDAQKRFAGVVAMDILIQDLGRLATNLDLGEGVYAFLVNSQGEVIAAPDFSLSEEGFASIRSEDHEAHEVADEIMSGETGIALSSSGVYYVYTPVQSADWTLCVYLPRAVILTTVEAMDQDILTVILFFLLIFAVITVAVIIAARRFSRQLTDPLMALEEDVRVISSGKLDYRAKVYSNDEIGDLAEGFNHMAEALQEYIGDLTRVTAEKERIGQELKVATQIQASMLPCIFPFFSQRHEFDLYASMTPAKEVGGDFYDFFMVDEDHLMLVMADVSGKGIPAALFMVIAKTLLKNSSESGRSPAKILEKVNNQLCENNEAEMFVTVWLGCLEISTGRLIYSSAGHEHPIVSQEGKYHIVKEKQGFVLAGMEDMKYRENELYLKPGDRLFLYTDGVTEATTAQNELYGSDRLLKVLNENLSKSPRETIEKVKEEIDLFVGEALQFDDITMLALNYKGGQPSQKQFLLSDITVTEVMAYVEKQLEEHQATPKITAVLGICIDEIVSNILHYGEASQLKVDCAVTDHTVKVSFLDDGKPFDPTQKEDPDTSLSLEERKIGGLGIYMVKKTVDRISYEYKDGWNVLHIEKSW